MKTFYALLVVMCVSIATSSTLAVAPTTKSVQINDSTITKLADGTKSEKHIYTYNEFGKKTIDQVFSWDNPNSAWVPTFTFEFTYNALNLNTLTIKKEFNTTTKVFSEKTKSSSVFDLLGREVSSSDLIIVAATGLYRDNLRSESTYDAIGNRTTIKDKWNTTTATWTAPYQKIMGNFDSISVTDTLGVNKKLFKGINTIISTYDVATSSYANTSKTEVVYQLIANKKPFVLEGARIGTISSNYTNGAWALASKIDFVGDSILGVTYVNRSNYDAATSTFIAQSQDTRYFSTRTISILAAVNNTSAIELTLSPNPVKDQLKVSGLEETAIINIVDLTGKAVIKKSINNNESISLGALTPGIYIAKVTNLQGELVYRTKLIKQ